ncbi:phosphohistidine phosphatase SixA [Saccharophagus degradans]|uniref:Phosphohistidine phosphatase SixA n=1 Tax=Saccharophagus degradans TaxID=86304 RepID=A0AAW7X273_9GAMM|nr:phosphohistidine phosphatase SixA [Saccharophagus degradans]MDO6421088.1 phosphohistidine phosphatase SixA [Saccharophagus degradans]MDO6606001.1 phosphohistidine phosphatase SixA [Saccharophagus degradans]
MELFVLRHGHAEAEASSDSLRPLSATGAKEIAEIYSKCSDSLANVELILVSPYVRAQQTLSTLTDLSPHLQNVPQQTTTLLVPGASSMAIIDYLYTQATECSVGSILLVSHQPLVGTLVDSLCNLDPGCYRMGTAAMASIDADVVAAGCAELRWLRHP